MAMILVNNNGSAQAWVGTSVYPSPHPMTSTFTQREGLWELGGEHQGPCPVHPQSDWLHD